MARGTERGREPRETTAHPEASEVPKPRRRRGRPPRGAGVELTHEGIIDMGLHIASEHGFSALTMHGLARELGVTARALYNHVASRQEIVDGIAGRLQLALPPHHPDPEDWERSLRQLYRDGREAYRRFGRAIFIFLDEQVSPSGIDPRRITNSESMLRFFTDLGLPLEQAVIAQGAFLTDLLGFTIAIDLVYDSTSDPERHRAQMTPVPEQWLQALPDVDAPLAAAAAQLPVRTSDEAFETFIDLRIVGIRAMLESARGRERD